MCPIAGAYVQLLVLIRGAVENLVGLWGGGALIACFPVHGIGCPL